MAKIRRVRKIQPIKQCFLRCLKCKNIQTIFRRKGKLREIGHYKHIYCIYCKKRTRHVEIDEFSLKYDMYRNYEGGN